MRVATPNYHNVDPAAPTQLPSTNPQQIEKYGSLEDTLAQAREYTSPSYRANKKQGCYKDGSY